MTRKSSRLPDTSDAQAKHTGIGIGTWACQGSIHTSQRRLQTHESTGADCKAMAATAVQD